MYKSLFSPFLAREKILHCTMQNLFIFKEHQQGATLAKEKMEI
jgi:hypothetical protein